jgi:hypothetical protein
MTEEKPNDVAVVLDTMIMSIFETGNSLAT